MTDRSEYETLYTDRNGRPQAKWVVINLVLVLFALFCLAAVLYLPTYTPDRSTSTGESEADVSIATITPDFAAIETVAERKSAFFEFLIPLAREENGQIRRDRARLQEIKTELEENGQVSDSSRAYIADLLDRYRFKDELPGTKEQIDRLLLRVDVVPVSMVLAQAATESAWGRSRFARVGNNFFGQWCFTPGCGEVPLQREEGMRHEVAVFDSPRHSVRSYLRNLNTHPAYRGLRQKRARMRAADENLAGLNLIQSLGSYSERGQAYVDELRQIITGNELDELDLPEQVASDEG